MVKSYLLKSNKNDGLILNPVRLWTGNGLGVLKTRNGEMTKK